MKRKTNAQPPESHHELKLGKTHETAAGIPGVLAAFEYMHKETGIFQGFLTMLKANQQGGFDCPSCAFPDPQPKDRSSFAEYCENGAKAIADEATKKRVTPQFFEKYSVEWLSRQSDYWLNQQGRLTHPMILRAGKTHYEKISWEAAFAHIAQKLHALSDPNEAIFYTSGRTSNEAAFMYQLFVRQFGTNNLPDCSNMCHESSGVALSETLGIGKGSVTLEDLYEAEVIMVVGQNPGTNHPRMLSALKKCKENGGKVVSINPLAETGLVKFAHPQEVRDVLKGGTKIADHFLQVRINGDVPLFKALLKLLWDAEEKQGNVFDHEFIKKHTQGYEAFVADLQKVDIAQCAAACGVPLSEIQEVANLCIKHNKIIICWAMGITQHQNGVENIREMVNLLLLKGSIGKKGAGTCPVRGHSNVQGDRTMGIWEAPKAGFLDKLQAHFHFDPPRKHGYNVVHSIQAMQAGKAKVFFALGGNFLSATPDTEFTATALQKTELTIQVSTKLNRSHLITGKEALILPCLGRTEKDRQVSGSQFVTVENSMGIVHQSQGQKEPASVELWSEPKIVAALAQSTLQGKFGTDWQGMVENYDVVRNHIEACIAGFENYNQRVRQEGGFYLPNGARVGKFNTDTQKAKFTVNQHPDLTLQVGQYHLTTIRSHDQFNTTIYGLDDRYRGIYNERRVLMMNPEDIKDAGFKPKQAINITSHFEGETRIGKGFLVVPYAIPRHCVAAYFPEANVLVPINHYAKGSYTPASKSVVVTLAASSMV